MTGDRPLGEHGLDLPFEPSPPGQSVDMSDGHISGGLVVLAIALPVPDHGVKPGLAFRFAKPDGSGFYPPMLLITDPDQLAALKPLVYGAVNSAIRAARELNARDNESGSTEGESV